MKKSFKVHVSRKLRKMINSRLGVALPIGDTKFYAACPCEFEPPCRVSGGVDFGYAEEVGAFSYFDTQEAGARKLVRGVKIGRYCSVAIDSHIGLIPHPTQWLSTAPVVYAADYPHWREFYDGKVDQASSFVEKDAVTEIGNDVWIGSGADIKRGVKIGNGAIVGAGAVVTKDVPPYAIVGGTPAKVLRYRFDEETVKRLETVKWWQYDLSSLGTVDFSDVNKALDVIELAVREGRAKPYVRRKIVVKDLYPYSRRCLFHYSCANGWLCIKMFGLWIAHFRFFRNGCRS